MARKNPFERFINRQENPQEIEELQENLSDSIVNLISDMEEDEESDADYQFGDEETERKKTKGKSTEDKKGKKRRVGAPRKENKGQAVSLYFQKDIIDILDMVAPLYRGGKSGYIRSIIIADINKNHERYIERLNQEKEMNQELKFDLSSVKK